jgi:hypothetical protein
MDARWRCHRLLWRRHGATHLVSCSQGDAVAADPSAYSPSLLAPRLVLPCVDTDRRLAVIRFMGHIDCAHYSAIPHARCNGFAF